MNEERYSIKHRPLPTLDPDSPYELSPDEQRVIRRLRYEFLQSERLQRHMRFMYTQGKLFRVEDGNLLFHGCVPMTAEGDFTTVVFDGTPYSGHALFAYAEQRIYAAFDQQDQSAIDFLWYLWCADCSPLCGRKLKTFERYFLVDESTWNEPMDAYYVHCETISGCTKVLKAFGLNNPNAHIVNGHTPVLVKEGISPLKADGKLVVIDGGFCRSLQKKTGIAGYTLIVSSHDMRIVAHQPFSTIASALDGNDDIHSDSHEVYTFPKRIMVGDTDNGQTIRKRIAVLETLLDAYKTGVIPIRIQRN